MPLDDYTSQVAEHFDTSATAYADSYVRKHSPTALFFQQRREIVMAHLRPLKEGRILDVGCGPGIYARDCVRQGLDYVGLDISKGMISEARKRFGDLPRADFIAGSMQSLPFSSDSFDALLCLGALEYVSEQDQTPCLIELARLIKPGGVLIFSFLNKNSVYWRWVDLCYPFAKFAYRNAKALVINSAWISLKNSALEGVPTRRFGMAQSLQMLHALGFSIRAKTYFGLNIFPPPLREDFAFTLASPNSRLGRLLNAAKFGWLAAAFVIVAEKSCANA